MCWRIAVLFAVAGIAGPASAQGPGWGHVEYGHLWTSVQADLSGEGNAIMAIVPLSQSWFLAASHAQSKAEYDDPQIATVEELEATSVGLGIHSTGRKGHLFAQLSHTAFEYQGALTNNSPQPPVHDSGVSFSMGYRYLERTWLTLEPEFGIAHYGDYALDYRTFGRFKVAVRLVPHVWAVGGYSWGLTILDADDRTLSAGIRLAWQDSTPARRMPPGAKVVGGPAPTGLALGQTLVALRALQLQQRPANGAPETSVIPKGASLVLLETTSNPFGNWWRVGADGQEGWIREVWLISPE